MRFMILVKATRDSEAGAMPGKEMFAAMATYHEELIKAGMLIDASGLQPSSKAWRIEYSGGRTTVVDGPFAETKELVAGYTIIRAASRREALEWTKRFPNPALHDGEIEVRQRRPSSSACISRAKSSRQACSCPAPKAASGAMLARCMARMSSVPATYWWQKSR